MTSRLAPSCAPASITCATSSRSSGTTSSPPSPRPNAASASRKSLACLAIWSASEPPLSAARSDIERPPSLERPSQRDLIGILEVTADGQAAGRPGDAEPERLDQPGQIGGCGFTFQVRVCRQDQLVDLAVPQPGHQLGYPQVFRADAVHGADGAAEHVIPAAELPDLLDGRHVLRFLHDTEHRWVTAHIHADLALVILCHVPARTAELDLLGNFDQGGRQPAHVLWVRGKQVKRNPLRAFGPDARKLPKFVDEILDDAFVHLNPRRAPACRWAASSQGSAPARFPEPEADRASLACQAARGCRRPRLGLLPAGPSPLPGPRRGRDRHRG